MTARLSRPTGLARANKPEFTNHSCCSVTSSSAVVRQFLGAEQRDEHNGDDQHNGHEQHLPGAAGKSSHDVRPVMRAETSFPAESTWRPGEPVIAEALRVTAGTGTPAAHDAFWGARYAIVEDPDGNRWGS
jgi:hypothetical protein